MLSRFSTIYTERDTRFLFLRIPPISHPERMLDLHSDLRAIHREEVCPIDLQMRERSSTRKARLTGRTDIQAATSLCSSSGPSVMVSMGTDGSSGGFADGGGGRGSYGGGGGENRSRARGAAVGAIERLGR